MTVKKSEITQRPEQSLLRELSSLGIFLISIWTTHHIKKMPPEAFRIIFDHLGRNYSEKTKEGMARSLGRREARDVVWQDLLSLYRSLPDDTGPNKLKEGVASSLHEMARPNDREVLIDLLSNKENGPTRVMFVRNLSRSKSSTAHEVLLKLRNEPDLRREIEAVLAAKLKRLKSRGTMPKPH